MSDLLENIKQTEWGISVTFNEGTVLNDENFLPTVTFVLEYFVLTKKNAILINAELISRRARFSKLEELIELLVTKFPKVRIAIVSNKLAGKAFSQKVEQRAAQRGIAIRYFHYKNRAIEWLLC